MMKVEQEHCFRAKCFPAHLALDLEQHLAFGVDLLLDGVVDVQQDVLALFAVSRQGPDEMLPPLVSQLLPLTVSLLQRFVPDLLSSDHLLLQLLQSGKGRIKSLEWRPHSEASDQWSEWQKTVEKTSS